MSIRIAVTGRQGQVARALAELGPALHAEVINIGRPQLDLAAPETVGPALNAAAPDIVVNAAAYTAVDQAEREPEIAWAVNGIGAGAVAAAARALGIPVIHLSTDYVFDGNKTSAYVEEDFVGPASAYGASKLAGEQAVAAATDEHVILRTAWVYAPYLMVKILSERCWRLPKAETKCVLLLISSDPRRTRPTSPWQSSVSHEMS